jgi:hypothetical protein
MEPRFCVWRLRCVGEKRTRPCRDPRHARNVSQQTRETPSSPASRTAHEKPFAPWDGNFHVTYATEISAPLSMSRTHTHCVAPIMSRTRHDFCQADHFARTRCPSAWKQVCRTWPIGRHCLSCRQMTWRQSSIAAAGAGWCWLTPRVGLMCRVRDKGVRWHQ